ncbi:hypothetical protein ACJVC5_10985 [Peredibacter sp. HCB2-198]|uniref:hypothetical protein n=1 Tax=Peredibacter sp. HCB2-198 TaxID=3383025 RepID=UPI0038B62610
MKLFILAFLLSVTSAFAHDLAYGPYLKMQEALANDDMKLAMDAHKFICDKELIHYKDDYKDCTKSFKNLGEVRNSFKQLSQVYIENGDKKELKTLTTATCPMAKAKWVQKNGNLKNPYLGKAMLECGEKI